MPHNVSSTSLGTVRALAQIKPDEASVVVFHVGVGSLFLLWYVLVAIMPLTWSMGPNAASSLPKDSAAHASLTLTPILLVHQRNTFKSGTTMPTNLVRTAYSRKAGIRPVIGVRESSDTKGHMKISGNRSPRVLQAFPSTERPSFPMT